MRRKWAVLGGAVAILSLLGVSAALALVSDSGSYNIQVTDKTQSSAALPTTGGAIVQYIGSSDTVRASSGTGIFVPFVRLQGSPTESGYNTNGPLQFDTKAGTWTHAILVSGIPIVTVNGVQYWELWNDINESNTAPKISLNKLEVYYTTNPNLTGYPTLTGATEKYAFSGSILINDVNQGSGRGDLRYLIPTAQMSIPPECGYNPASTTCGTYFLLYSQWGTTANYTSDGGFEEWKVKTYQVPNSPTLPTTPTAGGAIGTVLNDTATVTGGSNPTGSIDFALFAPGDTTCTGTALYTQTVALSGASATTSPGFETLVAGTYHWTASYAGDANNNPASSGCTAEPVVIDKNGPTLRSTPVVNIKDTLTVTGLTTDATGNVVVGLYTTATCTTGQQGSDSLFDASTNVGGTLTAATEFVGVTANTYYYKINYAGDTNNSGFTSCTESVGVTIVSVP